MAEGTGLGSWGAGAEAPGGRQVSRGGFLADSGKLLGGGALALALGGTALAADARTADAVANIDLKILNYALTLEHLERRFYVEVTSRFSASDYRNASIFNGLGNYLRQTAYKDFWIIRQHEEAHVHALRSTIKSLGGKPVPECKYNFGVNSVADAVKTAKVLENTGVMAYDGAIAYIRDRDYRTVGATIATIEGRHASYLNLINHGVPFPDAFDTPKAPQEICELVAKDFIVECPFDLKAFCKSLPDRVIAP